MSDQSYYVRIRGKVSGPFDIGGLQRLVRRGMLSRIHEVSQDRTTWSPAGDYEDLFPSPKAEPVAVGVETNELGVFELTPVDESSGSVSAMTRSTGAPEANYFYAQRGQSVGPVPVGVLTALAQNGTLGPEDPVWRQGDQAAVAARQLPALAPFYSAHLAYASPRSAADLYAGFWRRFGAWVVDTIILIVLDIAAGMAGGFIVGALMASANARGNDIFAAGQFVGFVVGIAVPWLYYACYESSSRRATPGKTILGLEVTTESGGQLTFGRASGRHFGKYISGLILGIGYFMAGWTQRKQALHDLMAGCLVVNK